ncbi:hypothetical protein SETIT_2G052600v2 [Setaria italica]|uniref:Uncharacterized protein n=1 Tax=Setaria italica TaxID=4555 RepID=A0A368PVR6_SETIT|nr:hypothetical protein SETIT_2G052600v2 [Setaria italica]
MLQDNSNRRSWMEFLQEPSTNCCQRFSKKERVFCWNITGAISHRARSFAAPDGPAPHHNILPWNLRAPLSRCVIFYSRLCVPRHVTIAFTLLHHCSLT